MPDSTVQRRTVTAFPVPLYTAAQVRELDRRAIAGGIGGFELMCRAGASAFAQLRQRWPSAGSLSVICGEGNNGGDGFVIAALGRQAGLGVRVWLAGNTANVAGDAALAMDLAARAGVVVETLDEHTVPDGDVVVDALLGIGLKGAPRPLQRQAIDIVNAAGRPVLAVDVPSGLCADSGHVISGAVRASCTVTFIAPKRGLYTGQGPAVCGDIVVDDLGVPAAVVQSLLPDCFMPDAAYVRSFFPPRRRDAHKGDFGHVVVVGGNHGMGGAVVMAAESAARCGAGLVSVASRPEHAAGLLARRPEAMFNALDTPDDLEKALHRATVVVCGPGLGRDDWARGLLARCLDSGLPLVLDADALNLLGEQSVAPSRAGAAPVVITPHPGEAARLLEVATGIVQADRFDAVCRLQRRMECVAVLKGAGTLVAGDGRLFLVPVGNPGMASGGMGDVLAGAIGALLSQGLGPFDAALCGVWLHGTAADLAARQGERGLLATDLFPFLRGLINGVVTS
jgi:hydroxyethylthiazole kinase-like uncharacterized protein yjeF